MFLTKRSQEAHTYSTQRLRSFCQEQKDQPECSSYFMQAPKLVPTLKHSCQYIVEVKSNNAGIISAGFFEFARFQGIYCQSRLLHSMVSIPASPS